MLQNKELRRVRNKLKVLVGRFTRRFWKKYNEQVLSTGFSLVSLYLFVFVHLQRHKWSAAIYAALVAQNFGALSRRVEEPNTLCFKVNILR